MVTSAYARPYTPSGGGGGGREGNQVSARQMEGYVIFSWREIAQDDGVAIFVAYKNMLTVNLKKP